MIRLSTISFIIISISCNSNPFWEDPKKNEFNLSGIAYGENNETDVPVSIWIETLDQYTTTGPGGYFSIPITNIQSSFGQFSGPIKLYYFIYNYRLDSSTVFFTNGMFSKYQTDFSSNGVTIDINPFFFISSISILCSLSVKRVERNRFTCLLLLSFLLSG